MKYIILNGLNYNLIVNYKEVLNTEELVAAFTEYFNAFDYVLGDYSYGKLRLKGFCKKENKNFSKINDYELKDVYLKDYCTFNCGYYILEKIV